MPPSNRVCYVCGARKPSWQGEEARVGRGVGAWLCRECVRDPAAGWQKRKDAQAKAEQRTRGKG